ncbi:ATP-binding protein [Domibacillus robiginosus]|uniref:ATP-binding protein n=1 Tax=Domibacillus robiginosus TaxID=1071054 RepID=UPI00067D9C80|nr:sensor histidine kinase [Domibacillus robiginosus]
MLFKPIRLSLLTQIALLLALVVIISTFLVSLLFSSMIDEMIESYMGKQAMTVAKLAAQNEGIIHAFNEQNPTDTMQPIAETIRKTTGASYVTIVNKKGIRYTNPNPDSIGKHTATSNDASLLKEQSVIYKDTGVSGPAIKAKTPIWNEQGNVIGVSSVGFLLNDIEDQAAAYRIKIIQLAIIPLTIGIIGAMVIARRIRKIILGLEPEEISSLFKEKQATLESIRDATIVINTHNQISSMNKKARLLFGDQTIQKGYAIKEEKLQALLREVLTFKEERVNQTIVFDNQLLIADLSPFLQNGQTEGVVLTARPVSEVEKLAEELSQIKAFSDNMRAQNHEFLNRLNTLYGLLRLGQYERAIQLISQEVQERQDVISFLVSSVSDPVIAACLLGKVNRSKELQVQLNIDIESSLSVSLTAGESQQIVSVIGNIIDNALEAARAYNGKEGKVSVSFTDFGKDIVFDIEDNGAGIPAHMEEVIFKEGYTTKTGENHGIGLMIVRHALQKLEGDIYMDKSQLGGTRFTIVLPKKGALYGND